LLFRISKIQFFESNSQRLDIVLLKVPCCSEYQRYNFLKAIHNIPTKIYEVLSLFRISKIQFFESNSQLTDFKPNTIIGCSEYQRYNFLKAIHNKKLEINTKYELFRISKIQFFESNSQLCNIFKWK